MNNNFTHDTKPYEYIDGKLFKLPHTKIHKSGRSCFYGRLECAKYIYKGVHVGFQLGNDKFRFAQIEGMIEIQTPSKGE